MKHSVRTPKPFFTMNAIDLLGSAAAWGIEEADVEIVSDEEDEEGHIDHLPNPREFVGLVVANYTQSNPKVFVARLLQLSADHKTAILGDFKELKLENSNSMQGKVKRKLSMHWFILLM